MYLHVASFEEVCNLEYLAGWVDLSGAGRLVYVGVSWDETLLSLYR
jgi:hypothetical protein